MSKQDRDQFGFYRVGDLKFYSKFEAIQMHTSTGMHPYWDFNESTYRQYDWTKEPVETLKELYKQRAEQIRNQYDYVVLMYSSGADSDNILHTFLEYDIKIDEIATFTNYDATGEKHDFWFNSEVFDIAIPKIEKCKEKFPYLKHRIIDICQLIIDLFSKPSIIHNWAYEMSSIINPNSYARNNLRSAVPEWQQIIDSGKKVALVWGSEKPRIHVEDGKFCFRFIDIVDNAVACGNQIKDIDGYYDEFFYWSPDSPKIPIKQAHLIKNYLKIATKDSMHMTTKHSGLGYKFIDGTKYSISTIGVHNIIYPWFEYRFANDNKPTTLFFGFRDNWFQTMTETDTARKNWRLALENIWSNTPDYWKNNPNDMTKAFKQCLSNPYFLE